MNLSLLIRADASPEIGTGHVMRCLALAEEWRDQGGNVAFAIAECTPAIQARLAAKFDVIQIAGEPGKREDAVNTSASVRKLGSTWLVLDGYRFGADYQQAVQDSGCKLLVIDDTASATRYCADIILNQNIHAHEKMYRNAERSTRLLLGPRFVLLRREFASSPGRKFEVREPGTRVLITMGGSDPYNVSAQVLKALEPIVRGGLEVVVLAGPGNRHIENLRRVIASSNNVRLVQDPKSLLDWMLWTDVAVSAGGSTVWELCRVGVPSILLTFAENQVPGARELALEGVATNLGDTTKVNGSDIASEVKDLLLSCERRRRISELGRALVDGAGCERVVAAMQAQDLKLRPATKQDCMLLFNWANDPAVRAASFQSGQISRDEHIAWFSERLDSDHSLIYIAEDAKGAPVGQFRADWKSDQSAMIDVSVAPEKRGLGIAERLIREGIDAVSRERGLRCFDAYIKAENTPSLKAFEKAGFDRVGELPNSVHWHKEVGRV